MLGHKAGLSKFKKTESISTFFHDHNAMRLPKKKKKKKPTKSTKKWKLNNILLNNQWFAKDTNKQRKTKTNEKKNKIDPMSNWYSKSSSKNFKLIYLPQEQEKYLKQSNFKLKEK